MANKMIFKNERQAYILQQINLRNKVSSTNLSAELKVSEDTIRRDLAELADNGELIKVHGGALSKSYHYPIQQNKVYAQNEKKIVAQKAIELLKPGITVLTEAGTTMLEFVKLIPRKLTATFFTVSPFISLYLAENPLLNVFLIGGEVDASSQIVLGPGPIVELSQIKVDLCILGVNALNAKTGLTEMDWKVAQIKKAMINVSEKLAIITISEKLNSELKMNVCKPEKIDYLITELDKNDSALNAYRGKMKLL